MTLVILAYCPCCSLPKQSCGRFEHCLAEIGPVLMCENMVRESWPPNDNRRRAQREEHPVCIDVEGSLAIVSPANVCLQLWNQMRSHGALQNGASLSRKDGSPTSATERLRQRMEAE
jgi:hypothetical protein